MVESELKPTPVQLLQTPLFLSAVSHMLFLFLQPRKFHLPQLVLCGFRAKASLGMIQLGLPGVGNGLVDGKDKTAP
jgi:hypothetical protein